MGALPVAFSLHTIASSVAADLGFAALLGLAILVLLFFAQARETATLRRRADELSERIAALEGRLAHARSAAAAKAQPPSGDRPGPPTPTGAAAAVGTGRSAPATGVAVETAAPARATAPSARANAGSARARARAGAAVNGGPDARSRPPGPTGVGRADGDNDAQRGPGTQSPPDAPAARTRADAQRVRTRRLAVVGLAALIVVGITVGVGLSDSGGHRPGSPAPARAASAPAVTAVRRSAVTVAVLNGTPAGGLANDVAVRLRREGFAKGPVTNAADQTRTATTVAYMPGHRAAALAVARALGLRPASVGSIDPGTRAVACGGATTCAVTVVVTVGSQYASR